MKIASPHSLPPDQIDETLRLAKYLPIMITVDVDVAISPFLFSSRPSIPTAILCPDRHSLSVHFCSTSSIPILLRFRGERSLLSSLSSSLSELRCAPAVAAAERVSWMGGMLEGPSVGGRADDDDTDGS